MLTQQELLVSELMGIMMSILSSKDDRPKKVPIPLHYLLGAIDLVPFLSDRETTNCLVISV